MKKTMIYTICFLFISIAIAWAAVTWHTANEFTVSWDAVTTNVDETAVPANEIEYELFVVNAITDPNKTNPTSVWRGPELTHVVTLNTEGQYLLGIRAIRVIDGVDQSTSVNVYSDDPAVCQDGVTFGVRYFIPLKNPIGFRPGG